MPRRVHPMFYVMIPLAALGLTYRIDALLQSLLLPLIIIAVLFGIYFVMQRRAPKVRHIRPSPRQQARRQAEKPKAKRTHAPFRVIEGRKNRGDEEPPRYH